MDDPVIRVTLTGPAKIGGKREPPGRAVSVSHTLALQLAASGAIDPINAVALSSAIAEASTSTQFDDAVEERVENARTEIGAQMEAYYAERFAAVTAALASARDERDKAEVSIADLTARLANAEARASNAEAVLAEFSAKAGGGGATDQPEGGETPPADGAANAQKAGKKSAA